MGKQSKRKRQRGKRPAKATTTTDESSSTLLQKLRHADPRTRHAALAALNATLLNPDELASSSRRVVSAQVLQATRERVMDDDLECAQTAAGCLANYVSFGSRQDKDELTAGWTLVFLQRLKQCQQALVQSQSSNRKQWVVLTAHCQHALCALIETNPEALERISNDALDLIRTLLGLLAFGQQQVETASLMSEQERENVKEITIYAVRTLHSVLDDNIELLTLWLESSELSKEGWNMVHACCGMTGLPLAARLHAAGCLVTARQLVISADNTAWTNAFHEQVIQTVLPLLQQHVELPADFTLLIDQYVQAQVQYEKQEADDAMERDVIQSVSDKKEPAREIARRQKKLKEFKKAQAKDEDMDQEDDGDSPAKQSDAREVLERARKSWHAAVSPLQLALELIANVTSEQPTEGNEDGMAMEEDDIAWGPEQEAQLMAGAPQMDNDSPASPLDAALLEALAQSGLGDGILRLLSGLCANVGDESSLPSDVKEDIEDLQSKCAACLGNCIGNVTSWQVSADLWKELRSAAESSTGIGTEGVFDTMAVAIRMHPELRKQIQADDLEFLVKQLSSASSDSIKSDVVCILGLLCSSESHPQEVNEKICGGLLLLLQSSSSAIVMSEVLNALMDMYGDDDHTHVFDSLDVLGNFQRILPRFKKRIQAEKPKAAAESVEQWRETALNASRFISYKKGQL